MKGNCGEALLGVTKPLSTRHHPVHDSGKQVKAVWRGTSARKPWRASVAVIDPLTVS